MTQSNSKEKVSFLIYKSLYEPIEDLSDEDLGKLFRAIFKFQIDGSETKLPADVKMAFRFFKNLFLVDDKKYHKVIERNQANGLKGGRPRTQRTQTNPKNPVGFLKPKKPDKELEKERDLEIDKNNDNENNPQTPAQVEKAFEEFKGGYGELMALFDEESIQKAKDNCEGWDFLNLVNVYIAWIKHNGLPDNIKAAFPSWCLAYTKGKSPK